MLQWVQDNCNTLFSGLGVYVISLLVGLVCFIIYRKVRSENKVNQKNIVAGGDVIGRDKRN